MVENALYVAVAAILSTAGGALIDESDVLNYCLGSPDRGARRRAFSETGCSKTDTQNMGTVNEGEYKAKLTSGRSTAK
jgi:hypothetical protein